MDWSTKLDEATWWVERLLPFDAHCVGSLVPAGFESVGRLFHPIEHDDDQTETWSSYAERNGRIAHAEMQLHAIGTPVGLPLKVNQFANATNGNSVLFVMQKPQPLLFPTIEQLRLYFPK